ncbi:MAG: MBL fold metallo-hydrolase [Phycisphaerales bacterium]|nr:MBL fold metallo-hydrolase [Phycisphaerales bacterium]
MALEYSVISIGTLSRNRLWDESTAVRAPHATTTLVVDGDKKILIDPSLPGQILDARFNERTGRTLADITDVFCTTLRPIHRRGLEPLTHANWWCTELEMETYAHYLQDLQESAERLDAEQAAVIEADIEVIRRFKPAPEKLTPQVHLYPLPGASVGSAGLLLAEATSTVLVAGDAVVTSEHFARGQVWQGCAETEAALESLQDVIEIADVIIPGHDNIIPTARKMM